VKGAPGGGAVVLWFFLGKFRLLEGRGGVFRNGESTYGGFGVVRLVIVFFSSFTLVFFPLFFSFCFSSVVFPFFIPSHPLVFRHFPFLSSVFVVCLVYLNLWYFVRFCGWVFFCFSSKDLMGVGDVCSFMLVTRFSVLFVTLFVFIGFLSYGSPLLDFLPFFLWFLL